MEDDIDNAFNFVKSIYDERDKQLEIRSFSDADWRRTKFAFDLFCKSKMIVDIGIGQGQLVNLFCNSQATKRVVGIDRTKHTKLILPKSNKFEFLKQDIINKPQIPGGKACITFAMEVFEHIPVDACKAAVINARHTAHNGYLFSSVPYQEKHPLFHFDKPYGHKQSFNDDTIANVFCDDFVATNFENRWYLIFQGEGISRIGVVSMAEFKKEISRSFSLG